MLQIKEFSVITNLVGIPMSILAFVLPPMMELRLLGFANVSKVRIVLYSTLAIVGLAICIVTTVYSFLGVDVDYTDCSDATQPCAVFVDPTAAPTEVPTAGPTATAVAGVMNLLRSL